MRTLLRWSLSSFIITTPRPCRAEPSRGMALPLGDLVEVFGVDRLEAWLPDRQPQQPPARRHHGGRRLRAYVALGQKPQAVWPDRLDLSHAGNGLEPLGEPLPLFPHPAPEPRAH